MITVLLILAAIYFGSIFSEQVASVYNKIKSLWKP
jgi:hypothetical protein